MILYCPFIFVTISQYNMEPRRKKTKNLETYFQSISVISSQEASTQDQQSSHNELETTPFSFQVDNFQSSTVNDFAETSTENVVDLGSIYTFPSRPILKDFPISNGRKFVACFCIEFIKALADETKWIVKVNLEVAGTYPILIDECKDNAGHEELALCFRYGTNMVT